MASTMAPLAQAPAQPAEQLLQLATGHLPSRCIWVAARLGIADLVAAGAKPVAELARLTSTNEDALYRVLRALASIGVFTEVAPRRFGLSPMAEHLRSGVPGSMRDFVLWISTPMHFRLFADFMKSVETGRNLFDLNHSMGAFEYFEKHPEIAAVFNAGMTNFSAMVVPAVLAAYDFSGIRTLVDVAGGHGALLTAILQRYPAIEGVLTDVPSVIEGARARVRELGLERRCRVEAVDFFKAVPAGGDAYIMKHIIHDWDDERALTILRNCHLALAPRGGKVLLLECVIAPGDTPQVGKWIDIEMLALPGGRERTEAEFAELFRQAGFRLARVVPTKSPVCVLEAESKG